MKTKFFIVVLIFITFNSCVDGICDDNIYKMFNQTDKSIKVIGYNIDDNLNVDSIVINPNSSFQVNRGCGVDAQGETFYSFVNVDSIRVIFDTERVKVYTRKNVINASASSIFDGDKNNQHFITEQDYESAADCNGNCD